MASVTTSTVTVVKEVVGGTARISKRLRGAKAKGGASYVTHKADEKSDKDGLRADQLPDHVINIDAPGASTGHSAIRCWWLWRCKNKTEPKPRRRAEDQLE